MSYRKHPVFRRPAFTLVEMLVAIGILTVIATLSVAVIPKLQERAKASRGGDLLQGWLLEARQMALRDRAIRGVRLLVTTDPNYGVVARQALYIQQPDYLTGGACVVDTSNPNVMNHVLFQAFPPLNQPALDVTGGQGTVNTSLWPIQPGDYIQIQGGQAHLITSVDVANNAVFTATAVWGPANLPPAPTTNYTIIRQARPMTGEPVLDLPDDVIVDLNLIQLPGNPLPPPVYYQRSSPDVTAATMTQSGLSYDILFTPSGTLTGSIGDGNGKIILWVRDATQDADQPGQQPLIVVFCRTGRTGGFPYNPNQSLWLGRPEAYPYYYVLDPRNTGL
jgi:prepilin-type N-terminal cleavage/methylation domain-containing protein